MEQEPAGVAHVHRLHLPARRHRHVQVQQLRARQHAAVPRCRRQGGVAADEDQAEEGRDGEHHELPGAARQHGRAAGPAGVPRGGPHPSARRLVRPHALSRHDRRRLLQVTEEGQRARPRQHQEVARLLEGLLSARLRLWRAAVQERRRGDVQRRREEAPLVEHGHTDGHQHVATVPEAGQRRHRAAPHRGRPLVHTGEWGGHKEFRWVLGKRRTFLMVKVMIPRTCGLSSD